MTNEAACALARFLSMPSAQMKEYASEMFHQINGRQIAYIQKRPTAASRYSVAAAENPVVHRKNRYINILPFDYNRLQLPGDDYINASLIEAPFGIPRRYIATQGPLTSTIIDFWRMVIEYNVRVIVALSPQFENGIEKCAQYWPEGDEQKEILLDSDINENGLYGNFKETIRKHIKPSVQRKLSLRLSNIQAEEEDKAADCIIRRIRVSFIDLSSGGATVASAVVTQLQFLGWADFSVPNDTGEVVALSRLADDMQSKADGPMVVHCSAGCGRTGTFCVVNSGLEWMRMADKNNEISRDLSHNDLVYTLTKEYRKQRTTMVQTISQFMFCYRALLDAYQTEVGPIHTN
ncbi:protein-tyrosine phosphatase-like protein [Dichotomocladium elegans]|nr:protein-tyrosine phosphatase-like protein [Dichotomocladium elegans]